MKSDYQAAATGAARHHQDAATAQMQAADAAGRAAEATTAARVAQEAADAADAKAATAATAAEAARQRAREAADYANDAVAAAASAAADAQAAATRAAYSAARALETLQASGDEEPRQDDEDGDRRTALSWERPGNSADSACTQFRNAGDEGTQELLIGLDFGTSSAKVTVRGPYVGRGGYVTIVQWPDGQGGRSYLLPTNLSPSGPEHRLTVEAKASPADRSLKVDLMSDSDSVEARAMAASYLAWVLRASRSHILNSEREIYGSYTSLRWNLNLGIPSAGYDDEQIKRAFLIAGKAAWALSTEDRPPTKAEAIATVNQLHEADTDPSPMLGLTEVEVVPEIVASAASYAQSEERRNGLHFLVDVGASTIDLCGFVLHEREEEDHWALLNALVEPLGVLTLHFDRRNALDEAGLEIDPAVPRRDAGPFDRIPDAVKHYLADNDASLSRDALDVDRRYSDQVVGALGKVIGDLKKNRDPNSPHWEEGLLVFVTGGGGGLSILRTAIRKAEERVRPMGVGDFRYMEDNADDDGEPDMASYDSPANANGGRPPAAIRARLGVAYGLSLPDVGLISPPSRIGDVKPPPPKPPTPRPDYWGGKR